MSTDRRSFTHTVEALRELLADCKAQSELLGDDPRAGSQADSELGSFQDPELVQTAISQGAILSLVVRDHVESLLRALAEPVLSMAPWGCGRSVIETAAVGCWLLEGGIGTQERVSRSFAYRYKGLEEQRKFAAATGKRDEVAKAERRIRNVASSAEALDLEVFETKERISGIARRMPSSTELAESSLACGAAYRLFSAMVHAHSWAFLQLGFEQAPASVDGEQSLAGVSLFPFRKAIPPVGVTFLCLESGNALYAITGSLLAYLGGDPSSLDGPHNRFTQRLQSARRD